MNATVGLPRSSSKTLGAASAVVIIATRLAKAAPNLPGSLCSVAAVVLQLELRGRLDALAETTLGTFSRDADRLRESMSVTASTLVRHHAQDALTVRFNLHSVAHDSAAFALWAALAGVACAMVGALLSGEAARVSEVDIERQAAGWWRVHRAGALPRLGLDEAALASLVDAVR